MELLWLTEKTENQIFRSKIRIFGVLRKLGSDKESIAYMLENIKRNYVTTLSAMQFGILTEESVTQDLMTVVCIPWLKVKDALEMPIQYIHIIFVM